MVEGSMCPLLTAAQGIKITANYKHGPAGQSKLVS